MTHGMIYIIKASDIFSNSYAVGYQSDNFMAISVAVGSEGAPNNPLVVTWYEVYNYWVLRTFNNLITYLKVPKNLATS